MKEFHARRTSNGINSATLRQFPMEGGEPATGAMVTGSDGFIAPASRRAFWMTPRGPGGGAPAMQLRGLVPS